jgi:hypothetical protein
MFFVVVVPFLRDSAKLNTALYELIYSFIYLLFSCSVLCLPLFWALPEALTVCDPPLQVGKLWWREIK